ncbi:ribonuclease H-like domain-containing protein [Tanacetum coccineum]
MTTNGNNTNELLAQLSSRLGITCNTNLAHNVNNCSSGNGTSTVLVAHYANPSYTLPTGPLGFIQSGVLGFDVDETFSPVVKPGTIQIVHSFATYQHWPIHQLDVKNAFLHGDLSKTRKYAIEILERAHMVNCNPSRTHVDTESKQEDDVQQLFSSFTTSLVAYSDADWAGCPTTRRSTSCYCVFLGNNILSWSSKRQLTLCRSSAEAEYHGVANVVAKTCWLRNLL